MNVNNTVRGFIPEIWDAKIYRTLEDAMIMKQIAKAPLEKKATTVGETINFTDLGDPTISDYTGTLTSEALRDSSVKMEINNTKTFTFDVKDLDKLMANADVQGSQTQRAGYNLANSIERHIMRYAGDDANAGTALTVTVNSANIISTLSELMRQLKENNVMETNAWIALPPWMTLCMKIAGISFSINEGLNGTGGMAWTKDLGFTVFESNTIYNSGTQASPVSTILAGSYQAIGYDDVQLPVRTTQLTASRATQVDGGAAFGYKVIKPKELAKLTATRGAETTI